MEIKTIEHEYTIVLYPSAANDGGGDDADVPDTIIWDLAGGDINNDEDAEGGGTGVIIVTEIYERATGFEPLETKTDAADGTEIDADVPDCIIWDIDTAN